MIARHGQGLIFHTQGFSVQDGPGLRTTLFLKGCPLRCRWCHNPESIASRPELMVHKERCVACRKCGDACPHHAIGFDPAGKILVDTGNCNDCLDCVSSCVYAVLEQVGKHVDVDEVVSELEKDEVFYRRSGGGVTISGGEPLQQTKFLVEVLQACNQRHIRTALDTCGFAKWSAFERVLPFVDLVLYDVKHMDSDSHRNGTGVDNRQILDNLRMIPRSIRKWLRIPLICAFNDSIENVRRTVELGLEVGAEKLSLLPYHDWSRGKYVGLCSHRPPARLGAPSEAHVELLRRLSEDMGLPCTVGS